MANYDGSLEAVECLIHSASHLIRALMCLVQVLRTHTSHSHAQVVTADHGYSKAVRTFSADRFWLSAWSCSDIDGAFHDMFGLLLLASYCLPYLSNYVR